MIETLRGTLYNTPRGLAIVLRFSNPMVDLADCLSLACLPDTETIVRRSFQAAPGRLELTFEVISPSHTRPRSFTLPARGREAFANGAAVLIDTADYSDGLVWPETSLVTIWPHVRRRPEVLEALRKCHTDPCGAELLERGA